MPIKRTIGDSDSPETDFAPRGKNGSSRLGSKVLMIVLIALVIALVSVLISYRRVSNKVARLSTVTGQKEVAKKEIDELVKKVSVLILLPTDETPTVATINDAEGLSKTQPFYQGSTNGDKVIIYFKAQKAFIYSPTTNKLVNVGPVYVDNKATAPTETPKEEKKIEKLDIEVRNGSTISGNASRIANALGNNSSFNIKSVENASTNTYKGTQLIDLTGGKKTELLSAIEKELGIKSIGKLPTNEKSSVVDVLVIVGN